MYLKIIGKLAFLFPIRNWGVLCMLKTYGGNSTMKYKHESCSRYISEGGGFSTEVVRIEVNGNVLYSVTDSTGNHLGYFDAECDAEAVAEDKVL